jgi:hypothetical protein
MPAPPKSKPKPKSMPSTPASSIPVLDETLPLGELRRNPDRMVILTQHSPSQERTPAVLENEEDQLASEISTKSEVMPDESILSIDTGLDDKLEDTQIRQILMDKDNLDNHSRVYAKYAIAITVVLVIIAFTYILL